MDKNQTIVELNNTILCLKAEVEKLKVFNTNLNATRQRERDVVKELTDLTFKYKAAQNVIKRQQRKFKLLSNWLCDISRICELNIASSNKLIMVIDVIKEYQTWLNDIFRAGDEDDDEE